MNIHFIALGGSVMHSLAIALKKAGHTISGSDDKFYNPSRDRLEAHGLLPEEGWHPDRIHDGLDGVILGMHAFEDNPELLKAQALGLNIQSFPEFVFEQSRQKQRVVIAGSYGKTTITGMVMYALEKAGRTFDYLVGAQIPGFDNPVRLSDNAPLLLVEGDEYLASRLDPRPKFLFYKPHIVVISGIAWDHINVFPSELEYIDAFDGLIGAVAKAGTIIHNKSDKTLDGLVKAYAAESHYITPYAAPNYRVKKQHFEVKVDGEWVPLKLIGKHNMENLAAAAAVCALCGVKEKEFYNLIRDYEGAQLRQDIVTDQPDLRVYRDYAHAPDKVKATLEAVRELFPKSHITAAVELHTFSSLDKEYIQYYEDTLKAADEAVVIVDSETLERKRKEAISYDEIQQAFKRNDIHFVQNLHDLPGTIQSSVAKSKKEHRIVLMMSSGNFGGLDLGKMIEK